jgi:hypothetical protein
MAPPVVSIALLGRWNVMAVSSSGSTAQETSNKKTRLLGRVALLKKLDAR